MFSAINCRISPHQHALPCVANMYNVAWNQYEKRTRKLLTGELSKIYCC